MNQKHYNELMKIVADLETEGDGAIAKALHAALGASTTVAADAAAPHADDVAVDRFAAAMKEKLRLARAKGRGGWEHCYPSILSAMLREHVEKGDPLDVANFCAFLWNLKQPITPAAQPAERPDPNEIQGWAVTVNVNAVDILTIGHNSLSGIDNIADFAPVVRNCAEHLLGFIGQNGEDGYVCPAGKAQAAAQKMMDEGFAEIRAIDAFEVYLGEQKHIIGMPGLHAKPCFIAGYMAARKAEIEREGGSDANA